AAVLSTILMIAGVASFRRTSARDLAEPATNPVARESERTTPRCVVWLLRVGLASMGVVFGMTTWVASSASIEMVMLFAVFPTTASAIAAMLTAGRRDMFISLLVPMALLSAGTLATSSDNRLQWLAALWVFYCVALAAIHSTLSKTL